MVRKTNNHFFLGFGIYLAFFRSFLGWFAIIVIHSMASSPTVLQFCFYFFKRNRPQIDKIKQYISILIQVIGVLLMQTVHFFSLILLGHLQQKKNSSNFKSTQPWMRVHRQCGAGAIFCIYGQPAYNKSESVHKANDSVNWFFKSHTNAFSWLFSVFFVLSLPLFRSFLFSLCVCRSDTKFNALNVMISFSIKMSCKRLTSIYMLWQPMITFERASERSSEREKERKRKIERKKTSTNSLRCKTI